VQCGLRCELQYNDNGKHTEQVAYGFNVDTWELIQKVEWQYDENNNYTEEVVYDRNVDTWELTQKTVALYDDNNNRTEEIFYDWNGDTWEQGDMKSEYQYNEKNKVIYYFHQIWDGFIDYIEGEYQYDENDFIISDIRTVYFPYGSLPLTFQYYYSPLNPTNISPNHSVLSNTAFFPNPATDYITVQGDASSTVTVTNLLGGVVYKQTMPGKSETINVSSWANGVYVITVETGGEKIMGKIVKR